MNGRLSAGYFYIVPATPYQKWGHDRVLPGIYPCCFTQWVARSKDLRRETWVDSTANPIMGFPGTSTDKVNRTILPRPSQVHR